MSRLTVELVGDIVVEADCGDEQSVFAHDSPHEEEVGALSRWLDEAGYQVVVRESVHDFADKPPEKGTTVVFPLWRGGPSRNRTAIVPAICEVHDLPYVGGDSFVQSVCQNKSLSKVWARAAGFDVPRECILFSPRDLEHCQPVSCLDSPCVVKPLSSGCSIGITDASLCMDNDEAAERAMELFAEGLGPVMCEEFVAGNEVSLCIIEKSGTITNRCLVGYRDANGICPFSDRLFTFKDKIEEVPKWSLEALATSPQDLMLRCAERLTRWLGRVDCFRFDGRMTEGGFVLVELTPDIHMALSSSFLGGFVAVGVPPSVVLDELIRTSLQNQGYYLTETGSLGEA